MNLLEIGVALIDISSELNIARKSILGEFDKDIEELRKAFIVNKVPPIEYNWRQLGHTHTIIWDHGKFIYYVGGLIVDDVEHCSAVNKLLIRDNFESFLYAGIEHVKYLISCGES